MFCSSCGKPLEAEHSFCSSCGQSRSSSEPQKPALKTSNRPSLRTLLIILVILSLTFGLVPRFVSWHNEKARQKAKAAQAAFALRQEADFQRLSANQHLENARLLLHAGAPQSQIDLGMKHLAALTSGTPEYAESIKLQKQFEAEKKQAAEQLKATEKQKAADGAAYNRFSRGLTAKLFENNLLDAGYNVDVRAVGKDQTTLRIKWVLVTKVLAHQLSKRADFFEQARKSGFKRVEITDGYDETWSWTLN